MDLAALRAGSGRLSLAELLPRSSKSWAQRAIAYFASEDHVGASLAAGLTVEHLAKFRLLKSDPTASAQDRKGRALSEAFLSGAGHPEVRNLGDVRTIQLAEAVKAAFRVYDLGGPPEADLTALVDGRNSAGHIGYADFAMSTNSVASMVRLLRLLLGGPEAASAWMGIDGDLESALAHLPHVGLDEWGMPAFPPGFPFDALARASVGARLWRSAARWKELCERIPLSQLRIIAVASTDDPVPDGLLRTCPTGGHLAWFEAEDEEDEDSEYDENVRFMRRYLDRVDCPLCGLRLQGRDELDIVGVGEDFGTFVWSRED